MDETPSQAVHVRMPTQRQVWAALGIVALVSGTPGPASADLWGDTEDNPIEGTGAHPDGGKVRYCYGATLPSHLEDNVSVAIDAIDDSQAVSFFVDTCDTSGNGQTDIVFEEDDFAVNNRFGLSSCDRWNTTGLRCDRANATIDVDEIRERTDADASDNLTRAVGYNWILCHEAGHDVGLTHYGKVPGEGPAEQEGQADCMRSEMDSLIGNTGWNTSTMQNLSAHHIGHLNLWF